ncbi:hypothetical protein LCGC14_0395520 [marine sediment metagenome]|uniref:Uncharacterized protein n=1 Tax=marine sediment metagenome TaxID=412755 RepID=A0A0F9VKE9_9ZZZZ
MNRRVFLSLLPAIPAGVKAVAAGAVTPPMVIRILPHPIFSYDTWAVNDILLQAHISSVRRKIERIRMILKIEDLSSPKWRV